MLSGYALSLTTSDSERMLPDRPVLVTYPCRTSQIRELMRDAYEDYGQGAPHPMYLLLLIRFCVPNAVAKNATLMDFPPEGLCRDEYVSPYPGKGRVFQTFQRHQSRARR